MKRLYLTLLILLFSNICLSQSEDDPWLNNLKTLGSAVVGGEGDIYGGIASGKYSFEQDHTYNSYSAYQPKRNDLLSGRIGANVTLGCDGINVGTIIDSRFSEYEAVIDSIISEAPSFIMYYLIYSQPTLAEFLDQLNTEFGWALELATMSCQNARKFAEENPFDYGTKYGKDTCIGEEGGSNSNCVGDNDEEAEEAKERKIVDIKDKISQYVNLLSSPSASSVQETKSLSRYTNIPIEEDCYDHLTVSSNSNINWTDTILVMGQVSCFHQNIYGKLLPTIKQEGSQLSEGTDAVYREKSVNDIYRDLGHEYFSLIDAVVKNAAVVTDSDGYNPRTVPSSSTGNKLVNDGDSALEAILARSMIPLEPYMIVDLQNAFTSDQKKYFIALSQMADRFALSEINNRLTEFSSGVFNGLAIAQQNRDLPITVNEEISRVTESLFGELDLITKRQAISSQIISDHKKLF